MRKKGYIEVIRLLHAGPEVIVEDYTKAPPSNPTARRCKVATAFVNWRKRIGY